MAGNQQKDLGRAATNKSQLIRSILRLGTTGSSHNIKELVPFLHHREKEVRMVAAGVVSSLIKESMLDNFDRMPEGELRKLSMLFRRLAPNLVAEISRDIRGPDERRRINAIRLLQYVGYSPAVERLVRSLLRSGFTKVRATAVKVMGSFAQHCSDHRLFQNLLNDSDPRVRANTIEVIEEIGDASLKFMILRFKNDGNNRIRANALKALYNFGNHNAVYDLTAMLQDPSEAMVISALWVSSVIESSSDVLFTACRDLSGNDNFSVRQYALAAMKNLSPHGRRGR
ncbi:MAG: HEAT repeat domain-containing protein [Fibrobacterota bacterium]